MTIHKIYICFFSFTLFFVAIQFLPLKLNAEINPQINSKLEFKDFEYLGAFRLPRGENGDKRGFSFGGSPIAYNPLNNSLFVGAISAKIAEVSIPTLSKSKDVEKLLFAKIIQPLEDPTEGNMMGMVSPSVRGLLVEGNKIFGTVNIYYDAGNTARVSHFSRSTDLKSKSATPLYSVWMAEKSGYLSGWIAKVPEEWETLLGGSIVSGNCCVPIVSRTSFGPSAFSWKPEDFGKISPVPATPLLYYPADHPTLGEWSGSNPVYGGTTSMGGMVIIKGSRTALYFGSNGTGEFCYGIGSADLSLVSKSKAEGAEEKYCYDPLSTDKGQHAYPYNYQIWAYDLNDFVAVKSGKKKPWDVKPYGVWKLSFDSFDDAGFGGVAYDDERQIIYISQTRVDKDGYSSRALIHAYKVNLPTNISTTTPKDVSPVIVTPVATSSETVTPIATTSLHVDESLQKRVTLLKKIHLFILKIWDSIKNL